MISHSFIAMVGKIKENRLVYPKPGCGSSVLTSEIPTLLSKCIWTHQGALLESSLYMIYHLIFFRNRSLYNSHLEKKKLKKFFKKITIFFLSQHMSSSVQHNTLLLSGWPSPVTSSQVALTTASMANVFSHLSARYASFRHKSITSVKLWTEVKFEIH